MDILVFLVTIALVILLWPLIKAYALFILIALVVYLLFFRNRGTRL